MLKALRKEPARRYATVAALSEDLRRYLQGLPVRRGRGDARATAPASSCGATAWRSRWRWASWASARPSPSTVASRRGALARERDRGERVTAFLIELFRVADPGEARGNTVTAREMLDKGTARMETELAEEPEVRAALLDTISQVHSGLGLYGKAVTLARQGLETRRRTLGDRHPDVAASLASLGDAAFQNGDNATAEESYRESLALRRALFGPEHPAVAASLQGVARSLREKGDYAAAEDAYRQATRHAAAPPRRPSPGRRVQPERPGAGAPREGRLRRRRDAPPRVPRAPPSPLRRGRPPRDPEPEQPRRRPLSAGQARGPRAVPREPGAPRAPSLGDGHPMVTTGMANLAGALADFGGDYGEAEALAVDVLRRERATFGPEHPEVARALDNRASILLGKGDPGGGEALYHEASAMWRRLHGPEHSNLALNLGNLAQARQQQGDDAGAERLAREALAMHRKLVGERTPQTAAALSNLGRALLGQGRLSKPRSASGRRSRSWSPSTRRPGATSPTPGPVSPTPWRAPVAPGSARPPRGRRCRRGGPCSPRSTRRSSRRRASSGDASPPDAVSRRPRPSCATAPRVSRVAAASGTRGMRHSGRSPCPKRGAGPSAPTRAGVS